MSSKISIIILCAGKGERMKSDLPKVLHKIAGKSMIAHVMDSIINLNPENLVTVINDSQESIKNKVSNIFNRADFAFQNNPRGTGDAVAIALKKIEGKKGIVLVLYGDTPFIEEKTIKKMISKIKNDDSAVVVLGFNTNSENSYGRLIFDENGNLKEIIEYKDASEGQRKIPTCNSGVMAVRADLIDELINQIGNDNAKEEYYLTDIVAIANDSGYNSSFVIADEDEVIGINTQYERSVAECKFQNKLRIKAMSEGVMMLDYNTVYLQKDTKFGKNVIIHQNVVIAGNVIIGDNVEIKAFSHLEDCIVKNNVIIGPYARIRPGTEINNDARIGNFVEIKKSLICEGAKINHLTYIGDSEIGKNANIGAGTVTCNYDGYSKFSTKIGEGAFIGSNTSLVAPVNIGNGAVIGAGSTIVKDVKDNSISRNEMPQINSEEKAIEYREKRGVK